MIKNIHIENFKSIIDLELEVSRVNLFIGENGSGKSNFLEALVFVSANQSNKLDNEFLVSRGLRVTEPKLIKSAFTEDTASKKITISIGNNQNLDTYTFNHDNTEYGRWMYDTELKLKNLINRKLPEKTPAELDALLTRAFELVTEVPGKYLKKLNNDISDNQELIIGAEHKYDFKNFLIYSPENTSLRIFHKEGQIQPLGINGEGLLKLLKVINNYEDKSYIETIVKALQLFNWFGNIVIPEDTSLENKVIIQDKYLYTEFDQRSANEGFLFILFYVTLMVAKETPKAFAIDNIDASLNPKLCTKLMKVLTELAHKYDKQIFLTTHNPAILDGIDLNDEEQNLFVVSRNKKGHTRMKNISVENKPKSSTNEPLKLSEAFLRGYLGGLPKGF